MYIHSISFVIPCYRSEHTIYDVVMELEDKLKELKIVEYEIILVNDCSPDNVWGKILKLCDDNIKIKGVLLAKNFGQHAALLAGYSCANNDIVISFDDDGQAPINELELLLNKIDEGYDVVYAYYEAVRQGMFRRFGTLMAAKMGQIMIGIPKDFKFSTFCVMKKYVVDEMLKYTNPYPYLPGLVFRTTRNITSVLTHQRNRAYGSSSYKFSSLLKLWMNGFTAFSIKPIRFGTMMGMGLSAIGFIIAVILIINKIIEPNIAVGWTSIISAILIMGGLILAMLGLVGEYIGRIYISINNSPQYVIKEIITGKNNDN